MANEGMKKQNWNIQDARACITPRQRVSYVTEGNGAQGL